MSGAPVPATEVIIANYEDDLRLQDEFALDDESDDDSVHTSAVRRFSRRESRNAERSEVSGILSTNERRASRRESQSSHVAEFRRRGSNLAPDNSTGNLHSSGTDQRHNTSTRVDHRSDAADSHPSTIASLPTFLSLDQSLSTRRLSRTTENIKEERARGITFPEPTFQREDPIKEVDSIPPTPAVEYTLEYADAEDPRATGKIASWRGGLILGTACFAQLIDNIWMTSINIAVPKIAEEFDLVSGSQSWLVSAYTLTFGGFLLLAGVLSDRFGRRYIFTLGMLWMAVFSVAAGVSQGGIQCIIFRAMQGLGAAASVPSAIGVLSTFFVGNERHRALSMFGAAGAVGFVVGLVMGGLLAGTLGWRYVFYICSPIIFILSLTGWWSFPKEVRTSGPKPSLDFLGAALGTSGMILMTFALSQSEVTGWGKPVIIVTLILAIIILLSFTWAERKVANPLMPLYLWKLPSFAGIWCSGFLLYCWWSSVNYYLTLISQEVLLMSPLITGLYLIPEGVTGFFVSLLMGRAVEKYEMKYLLMIGFLVSALGTLPAAFVQEGSSFWAFIFPTSVICVTGVSITYNVASIALVSAVPPAAKSLAGGLINTAFQIGSGFGLAITSLVNENVLKKQADPDVPSSLMKGYQAALFTSCGLVGFSFILSVFAIRKGQQATAGMVIH